MYSSVDTVYQIKSYSLHNPQETCHAPDNGGALSRLVFAWSCSGVQEYQSRSMRTHGTCVAAKTPECRPLWASIAPPSRAFGAHWSTEPLDCCVDVDLAINTFGESPPSPPIPCRRRSISSSCKHALRLHGNSTCVVVQHATRVMLTGYRGHEAG